MKKKWIIIGDERAMMKNIFELNDQEIDQVKDFMEMDFKNTPDLLNRLIKSKLNARQKILASYVAGNTIGMQTIDEMKNTMGNVIEHRRDDIPHMAG